MKRLLIIFTALCLISINNVFAQNPFKEFGYEVKVMTLSKGKYIEFIPYDSIQRIGSVVINVKTGKIIELVNTDSVPLGYNYRPDVASRWISPDPLAEEYWNWSPYNYTMNNPIRYIDPNGMFVWEPDFDAHGNLILKKEKGDNAETFQQEMSLSGYNISIEQASEIVNNQDGGVKSVVNLTDFANSEQGQSYFGNELSNTLNNLKSQYELSQEGSSGVCWDFAINDKGSSTRLRSRHDAQSLLENNYFNSQNVSDVNFKIGETKIGYYATFPKGYPKISSDYRDGPVLKHANRFVWQNNSGKIFAANKMATKPGLNIQPYQRWEPKKNLFDRPSIKSGRIELIKFYYK